MDKLELFIKQINQKLFNSNFEEEENMEILNNDPSLIKKYDAIIINEENMFKKEEFNYDEKRNKKKEKKEKKEKK